MEERMTKIQLLELINSLKIDKDEFYVVSSGNLVLRGILETAGDLDLAVSKKGLKQLKENYSLIQKDNGWYIVNDKVECFCNDDIKNMPYKPELLECEVMVQNINEYFEYLKSSLREKDIKRIPLVEKYIKNRL